MNNASSQVRAFPVWLYPLLITLFAAWGAQQVAIKIGNGELSPIYQAGLRSVGAAALMTVWFVLRGTPPWSMGVRLWQAGALGVLFTLDFALLFVGLETTSASRGTVLYYTAPIIIAAGTAVLTPADRMGRNGLAGLLLAFAGVAIVLWRGGGGDTSSFAGDLFCLGAAGAWAITILLIKATSLTHVSASAALYFQLLGSAILLPVLSLSLGETWTVPTEGETIAALLFQAVIVAFISYLIFFWILKRYSAAKLSAYSFLAPVFGVALGGLVLGDPITGMFGAGAVLVILGLVLVTKDQG